MSGAGSAASFQQRLESCASSIGYGGKMKGFPREAWGNRRVAHFLQWLLEQLSASNSLSQSELDRFEEVKKTGVILEGAELREAVKKVECCSEERPVEELRSEVSSLQQSVAALKTQLQSLNSVQSTLSGHHSSLLKEREHASTAHTNTLASYQASLHTAQTDNTKVNSALESLQSAVDEVTTFHNPPQEGEEEGGGEGGALLSYLPSEQYTSAEDNYLTELTAYTKKQFFQGIAVMAHTPSVGEEVESGVVDLSDPANILMRGSSSEQYSSHCQELARLKELYPVVETQRVSDLLAQHYAEAVCERAEEMVTELQQSQPLDANVLRQHIKERQARLGKLHSQTRELAGRQLPGLVQEMATLEVSTVLHGDYSLKMARQDYFTSKQDKVISCLLAQTSRQELLSMLYEVELRRHRDTHRLLSAASSQLHSWREQTSKRNEAMQSSSLLPVKEVRQTIDSRDLFALRLCSMLGVSASGPAPQLLTHSSLERAVGVLVQRTASLEALLSALESERQHTMQEVVTMSELLGKRVFGSAGGSSPQLTVQEYEEECSKLECLLGTMEQNIKRRLSDFDSKKKCLQGNELIQRERKLFVYFFTDPKQLTREVADLSRRVDTIITARQTST